MLRGLRPQQGMVALLLLVLLATAALTVVMARTDPSNDRDLTARQVTLANLERVEMALAAFTMQNKRLPCPASGKDLSVTNPSFAIGTERRLVFSDGTGSYEVCQVSGTTQTGNQSQINTVKSQQFQTDGVVPWRSLGLKRSEVMDGWGNLLTYRVHPELVNTDSIDLTTCHPLGGSNSLAGNGKCKSCSGSGTNAGSFSSCNAPGLYTLNKGLKVIGPGSQVLMDPAGTAATNNGAAYIVISHGENGAGAYSVGGIAQTGRPAAGSRETQNAATTQFMFNAIPDFYDDAPSLTEGTAYFDDLVLRPRILDVANAASLGPRMR